MLYPVTVLDLCPGPSTSWTGRGVPDTIRNPTGGVLRVIRPSTSVETGSHRTGRNPEPTLTPRTGYDRGGGHSGRVGECRGQIGVSETEIHPYLVGDETH